MYGNGVKTGMAVIAAIHRPILLVLRVGLSACFATVAGTTARGSIARLFATATLPTSRSATLGSAWSSPSNNPLTVLKYHSGVIYTKLSMQANFLNVLLLLFIFFATFALDFLCRI